MIVQTVERWPQRSGEMITMRTSIVAVGFLLLGAAANADPVLWNNGAAIVNSFHCDLNYAACSATGWTIGDDFTLISDANVTGFTYNDVIVAGSPTDYTGTAWNLWGGDPFAGGALLASGLDVGTVSSGLDGMELVTVSGLNAFLSAGTYWLGIETQEANLS